MRELVERWFDAKRFARMANGPRLALKDAAQTWGTCRPRLVDTFNPYFRGHTCQPRPALGAYPSGEISGRCTHSSSLRGLDLCVASVRRFPILT